MINKLNNEATNSQEASTVTNRMLNWNNQLEFGSKKELAKHLQVSISTSNFLLVNYSTSKLLYFNHFLQEICKFLHINRCDDIEKQNKI